jgi:outer membrane protein
MLLKKLPNNLGGIELTSPQVLRQKAIELSDKKELSLEECYILALAKNEQLAIAGEDYMKARYKRLWAISYAIPNISLNGDYFRQQKGISFPESGGSSVTFSPKDSLEYRFTGNQPLFTGLREINAVIKAGWLIKASESDAIYARNILFERVAEKYFQIAKIQKFIEVNKDSLELNKKSLERTQAFYNVGEARKTDLLALETEVAQTEAELIKYQNSYKIATKNLAYLINTDLEGKTLKIPDISFVTNQGLDNLTLAAYENREDLQSYNSMVKSAKKDFQIAIGAFSPDLGFQGNYYGRREGIFKDIDWDFALVLSVPLFDGGRNYAGLKDAKAALHQTQLAYDMKKREIETEVATAWEDYLSNQAFCQASEKAKNTAQASYDLVSAQYVQGLVSYLDLFHANNALLQARVLYETSILDRSLSIVNLLVAMGQYP